MPASAGRHLKSAASLRSMPLSTQGALPGDAARFQAEDVQLPSIDIRARLDERAFRNLTESSRRVVRIAGLVASDAFAGFLGVATVEATWRLVSSGGRRPLPDDVPLLAMVLCLQPLALRVTGAYAGGKARTDFLKIAGGIVVAAFLGWVQAQLFGRDVPSLPNKAA